MRMRRHVQEDAYAGADRVLLHARQAPLPQKSQQESGTRTGEPEPHAFSPPTTAAFRLKHTCVEPSKPLSGLYLGMTHHKRRSRRSRATLRRRCPPCRVRVRERSHDQRKLVNCLHHRHPLLHHVASLIALAV